MAGDTTASAVVDELRKLGTDPYKRILLNHGIREPVFGVKIEHLKKIEKRTRKNHQLALDLYDTGVYDAQYLAGLIADETKMTAGDLRRWLKKANCPALCGTAVAWVAAESRHGFKLALEWIESKDENVAQAGWTTLGCVVALRNDADLDLAELERLLRHAGKTIHQQPNHVRYAMNGFVIAAGSYVRALADLAIETAESIGVVSVDMGNTACKVPAAPAYIRKAQGRGSLGKKRKTVRC
jgi:3-methyladenine DNA glycosylase AlkD